MELMKKKHNHRKVKFLYTGTLKTSSYDTHVSRLGKCTGLVGTLMSSGTPLLVLWIYTEQTETTFERTYFTIIIVLELKKFYRFSATEKISRVKIWLTA